MVFGATRIQAWYRMLLAVDNAKAQLERARYRSRFLAAQCLQSFVRGIQAKTRYEDLLRSTRSATKLQSSWRRHAAVKRKNRMTEGLLRIQCFVRKVQARRLFGRLRRQEREAAATVAATKLQSWCRGMRHAKSYHLIQKCIVKLQAFQRMHQARRQLRTLQQIALRQQREAVARKIQRWIKRRHQEISQQQQNFWCGTDFLRQRRRGKGHNRPLVNVAAVRAATRVQALWRGSVVRHKLDSVFFSARFVDDDDFNYDQVDIDSFLNNGGGILSDNTEEETFADENKWLDNVNVDYTSVREEVRLQYEEKRRLDEMERRQRLEEAEAEEARRRREEQEQQLRNVSSAPHSYDDNNGVADHHYGEFMRSGSAPGTNRSSISDNSTGSDVEHSMSEDNSNRSQGGSRQRLQEKYQEMSREWGFKDSRTAELMLKRRKRMMGAASKRGKKKKSSMARYKTLMKKVSIQKRHQQQQRAEPPTRSSNYHHRNRGKQSLRPQGVCIPQAWQNQQQMTVPNLNHNRTEMQVLRPSFTQGSTSSAGGLPSIHQDKLEVSSIKSFR
eukprot:g3712.t1